MSKDSDKRETSLQDDEVVVRKKKERRKIGSETKSDKEKNIVKNRDSSDNLLEDLLGDDTVVKETSTDHDEEKLKESDMAKKVRKKKKKDTSSKKKNKRAWWKKLLSLFIVCCFIGILGISAFFMYIVVTTPDFDPNALASQEQTIVYDRNGKEITTLGMEKRELVSYDALPQVLIDAIVATEDSRFFQHNGVDMARFLKASVGQVLGNSSAGGASTLTMQVAKNNLTSTKQTIVRKFRDMYLSTFVLERKYTKEEILEFYVNDSLLGGNVYGVEEASQYYFGKTVSELSLPEAALIAGLFQSPNGDNPYYYPEKATKRRSTVLKLMVRHGYITQEEADIANSVDVTSLLVGEEDSTPYQGYINTVIEEVIDKTGNNPSLVPMKIYTALDTDMQDGINSIMSGDGYKWENDVVQAGIAVVDCNSGEIVAIGAGRDSSGSRTWNYATMIERQPGSTAKPLFAYGPGMEYNNFSTYTLFNDEDWQYSDGTEIGNWDNNYLGLITLRKSLQVSRNIPALKAFQQVKNSNIIEFVQNLGIEPEIEGGTMHEAHSIGGFTGVSPLEMASAYASFANGGYYNEPHAVTKIEYRTNDVSTSEKVVEFKATNKQVMSASTAYMMNNVLQSAVESGFNGGAKVSGSVVAAKTGTSNYDSATLKKYGLPSSAVNDLWTVAYTPDYSIALWYGYDEISSEYYNTSGTPKDNLMKAIMKYIPKNTTGWEVPSSVVASQVEMGTWPAQLPSEYTPNEFIITEYFKKGTEPTEVSQRFSKLSDVKNMKAEVSGNKITVTWDEAKPEVVTTEYLNKYFSQSVFGNGTSSLVSSRLNYINNTMGGFGYGIYIKDASGNLKLQGFTQDTSYSFTPSSTSGETVTVVVKAQYKSFTSNASDGVSQLVNWKSSVIPGIDVGDEDDEGDSGNDNSGTTTSSLEVRVIESTVFADVGNYSEDGITVVYKEEDVTDKAKVTYSVKGKGISCSSVTELEAKINELGAGSYTITYTATYKNKTASATRKLTLK